MEPQLKLSALPFIQIFSHQRSGSIKNNETQKHKYNRSENRIKHKDHYAYT